MTCKKCNDTGWFQYDHNHSTICNMCCKHDKGWWLLVPGYSNVGKWCCGAGCGHTLYYKELKKKLMKESNHMPIFMEIRTRGD